MSIKFTFQFFTYRNIILYILIFNFCFNIQHILNFIEICTHTYTYAITVNYAKQIFDISLKLLLIVMIAEKNSKCNKKKIYDCIQISALLMINNKIQFKTIVAVG